MSLFNDEKKSCQSEYQMNLPGKSKQNQIKDGCLRIFPVDLKRSNEFEESKEEEGSNDNGIMKIARSNWSKSGRSLKLGKLIGKNQF